MKKHVFSAVISALCVFSTAARAVELNCRLYAANDHSLLLKTLTITKNGDVIGVHQKVETNEFTQFNKFKERELKPLFSQSRHRNGKGSGPLGTIIVLPNIETVQGVLGDETFDMVPEVLFIDWGKSDLEVIEFADFSRPMAGTITSVESHFRCERND